MKKLLLIGAVLTALLSSSYANIIKDNDFVSKQTAQFSKEKANAGELNYKEGFLASKECVEQGLFKDCNLDSYERSQMVLYVHDENRVYSMKMNNDLKVSIYENAINQNGVKFFGKIDKNIINVAGLSVPIKAKAEFFKGCL